MSLETLIAHLVPVNWRGPGGVCGFFHRDMMTRTRPMAHAEFAETVPVTALPVDCSGNASVSAPIDDNDIYGICGPAMCDHGDGIRTFGQGKPGFVEINANVADLLTQYLAISGGDNGTDEEELVGPGGIWVTGIAGNAKAVVVDYLDVDATNVALRNYVIDQFFYVCMAWSVPDAVIHGFTSGGSFLSAMTPNPANGHYSGLADVDENNNTRVWTWGGYFWASPTFLASVQPQCFATFSALQFGADGYDSHGRHVSDQAQRWVALGGSALAVASVVSAFPPKSAPPAPVEPGPLPDAGPVSVPTHVELENNR